jgi:hypothetical protein
MKSKYMVVHTTVVKAKVFILKLLRGCLNGLKVIRLVIQHK